jgi:hypothetical protein
MKRHPRQRLVLVGSYPDAVWTCAWCEAELSDGFITHWDDCRWLAEIAAAERERLLTELRVQFTAPRGADGSFLDGWRTAVGEFDAIVTDPGHQLAPLADMVTRMRAGRPAETPRQWFDDGRMAERERIRAGVEAAKVTIPFKRTLIAPLDVVTVDAVRRLLDGQP